MNFKCVTSVTEEMNESNRSETRLRCRRYVLQSRAEGSHLKYFLQYSAVQQHPEEMCSCVLGDARRRRAFTRWRQPFCSHLSYYPVTLEIFQLFYLVNNETLPLSAKQQQKSGEGSKESYELDRKQTQRDCTKNPEKKSKANAENFEMK